MLIIFDFDLYFILALRVCWIIYHNEIYTWCPFQVCWRNYEVELIFAHSGIVISFNVVPKFVEISNRQYDLDGLWEFTLGAKLVVLLILYIWQIKQHIVNIFQ